MYVRRDWVERDLLKFPFVIYLKVQIGVWWRDSFVPHPDHHLSYTPAWPGPCPAASDTRQCTSQWLCRKPCGDAPTSPRWLCHSGHQPEYSLALNCRLEIKEEKRRFVKTWKQAWNRWQKHECGHPNLNIWIWIQHDTTSYICKFSATWCQSTENQNRNFKIRAHEVSLAVSGRCLHVCVWLQKFVTIYNIYYIWWCWPWRTAMQMQWKQAKAIFRIEKISSVTFLLIHEGRFDYSTVLSKN